MLSRAAFPNWWFTILLCSFWLSICRAPQPVTRIPLNEFPGSDALDAGPIEVVLLPMASDDDHESRRDDEMNLALVEEGGTRRAGSISTLRGLGLKRFAFESFHILPR